MRLSGKVALITGGASGMGRSEATIFAREGARVVVGDVLEADGREVAEKIAAAGGQGRVGEVGVTSETDWEPGVSTTGGGVGEVDVPVHNAGRSGACGADQL